MGVLKLERLDFRFDLIARWAIGLNKDYTDLTDLPAGRQVNTDFFLCRRIPNANLVLSVGIRSICVIRVQRKINPSMLP